MATVFLFWCVVLVVLPCSSCCSLRKGHFQRLRSQVEVVQFVEVRAVLLAKCEPPLCSPAMSTRSEMQYIHIQFCCISQAMHKRLGGSIPQMHKFPVHSFHLFNFKNQGGSWQVRGLWLPHATTGPFAKRLAQLGSGFQVMELLKLWCNTWLTNVQMLLGSLGLLATDSKGLLEVVHISGKSAAAAIANSLYQIMLPVLWSEPCQQWEMWFVSMWWSSASSATKESQVLQWWRLSWPPVAVWSSQVSLFFFGKCGMCRLSCVLFSCIHHEYRILTGGTSTFFPQQRKLTGSSAQISSGVCQCGSQEQVPKEGSGRFRRVPVCWCRFRRQVPKVPACAGVGSGGFRCVLLWVPEGCGGFRTVPARAGLCGGKFRRQVPQASSGRFRRVPVWFVAWQPWQEQPCDYLDHLLVMALSTWAASLRKRNGAHVVKRDMRIYICVYTFLYIYIYICYCCWGYHPGLFSQLSSIAHCFVPQQRKLMGSSAQISSGVRRCGSQEEGSGRFRKVPESSGVLV